MTGKGARSQSKPQEPPSEVRGPELAPLWHTEGTHCESENVRAAAGSKRFCALNDNLAPPGSIKWQQAQNGSKKRQWVQRLMIVAASLLRLPPLSECVQASTGLG